MRIYLKRAVVTVSATLILLLKLYMYIYSNNVTVKRYLEGIPSSQYIIDSPKCRVLNLNPFDVSVLKFVEKTDRVECLVNPPITSVVYNASTKQHVLVVNASAIPYYIADPSRIKCCFKTISSSNVLRVVFGPCQRFFGSFIMEKVSQFLFIFCLNNNTQIVYENMHAIVERGKRFNADAKKDSSKLNVLLLGLDSMSRLNFYRTMPKTASHLHTHGWVEMKGYNKIADNTLPNMMAFLAGLPPDYFRRPQTLVFDSMPFIWKEFARAGYATAYAEDQPIVSTFHCHLRGFRQQPTDHYFRDYIHVGELLLMGNGRPPGCIASKLASDHVFDYLLDFVTVYKDDSFFGLFWVNQISHNDMNRGSGEDGTVLRLLERLEESGAINTTMVVLLSDHGLRVGDLRRTSHGWYEERLPLLFISLPEWYRTQNDAHYSNLLINSNRLTSPYDLYMTMKHVLYGRKSPKPVGCKSCHSLLAPVKADRSCAEAGISPHWCTCHPIVDFPDTGYSHVVATRVVDAINEMVADDPDIEDNYTCETLEKRSVLYMRKKDKPGVTELVVGVATEPGGVAFEATVQVHRYHVSVQGTISRLSSYGNETSCALNPVTKLYCYCKRVSVDA